MTAIMGVKGSGKTVLMDILAGRNTPGRTKGSILVRHKLGDWNLDSEINEPMRRQLEAI